jgi:phage tail-like protein
MRDPLRDPLREPFGNMHFRIEIERMPETGAVEVIFPQARIELGSNRRRSIRYGSLVLRRGVTRSRDWYDWWHEARRARVRRKRTVAVILLDTQGGDVHRWTFDDSEPLGYSLSSLDALGNAPLIETLELAVGGFVLA